jgi:hypothetical protein
MSIRLTTWPRWIQIIIISSALLALPAYYLIADIEIVASPLLICFPLLTLIGGSIRLSAIITSSRECKLVLATFYVFVYVFLGVAALLQVASNEFSWDDRFDDTTAAYTSILIWIGLAGLEVGYGASGTWLSSKVSVFFNRHLSIDRAVLMGAIALVVSPILFSIYGGIGQVFQARVEKLNTATNAIGGEGQTLPQMINAFERVPIFICFAVILVFLRQSPVQIKRRRLLVAFAILLGAVSFIASNPVNSERYWAGTTMLSSLMLFQRNFRPSSVMSWSLALVFGLVFVFPFSDLFRISVSPDIESILSIPLVDQILHKGDYDSFQQIGNGLIYVKQEGLRLGQQILASVGFWFPRSFWPDKSAGSGGLVADALGYSFDNLSMPLWGEFYLDGGVPFVLVGFFLYGNLIGGMDRAFQKAQNLSVATVLVPIYAIAQMITLRGSLIAATSLFAPVVGMVFLCSVANRKSDR